MNAYSRDNPGEVEKQAFVRGIEVKLAEKHDRLDYIKRKVRKASESRRIQMSEQLLLAEHHADKSVAALKSQLLLLKKADDESWSKRRYAVEVAWDELSQAIKKVVARFP